MSADTTGDQPLVLVDDPAPRVRRLTLNRPEKRNAISNALRAELYDALHAADRDPSVGVSIIRGAGPCFSSGYDLKSSLGEHRPFYTPGGDGTWSRHVTDGWSRLWDLAKPVIAQVHGYAMAGGTELDGRLRPRVRRRRRAVQLSGRARAQPARLPVPPVAASGCARRWS